MAERIDLLKGSRDTIRKFNLSGQLIYLDNRPFIVKVGSKGLSSQAERAVYKYLMSCTGKVTVFDRY